MDRRSLLRCGIPAALIVTLAASWGARAAEPIRIGAPFNLTGALASTDAPAANGAKLAAKQINAAGGVLGRPIELVAYDGKSDPTTIATVGSQLINSDKVVAMVGFTDSDSVLAIGPQIEKAGIPFVTPGATSPRLPTQIGKQVFLACFGDNVQAAAGAQFAVQKLHGKTAYLITDSSTEYTTLLSGYFQAAFLHDGGKIIGRTEYKQGDKSFTAQITKVKATTPKPDFIYIAANPDDIGLVVKQFRQAGVTLPIVGGDGYDTPLLLQVGGKGAENVYFSTHSYLGEGAIPEVQAFAAAYQKEFGTAPENAFAVLGYDAVNLVADAIRRAGSTEPAKIRDALAATDGFKAITGTISYPPGSAVPKKTVTIIAVKDGKLTLGDQTDPSFVPPP